MNNQSAKEILEKIVSEVRKINETITCIFFLLWCAGWFFSMPICDPHFTWKFLDYLLFFFFYPLVLGARISFLIQGIQ